MLILTHSRDEQYFLYSCFWETIFPILYDTGEKGWNQSRPSNASTYNPCAGYLILIILILIIWSLCDETNSMLILNHSCDEQRFLYSCFWEIMLPPRWDTFEKGWNQNKSSNYSTYILCSGCSILIILVLIIWSLCDETNSMLILTHSRDEQYFLYSCFWETMLSPLYDTGEKGLATTNLQTLLPMASVLAVRFDHFSFEYLKSLWWNKFHANSDSQLWWAVLLI